MQVYGAHALVLQDAEGLKTLVWKSVVSGKTPGASPTLLGGPQLIDLTQQGIFFQPLIGRQGPVPALLLDRQDDPSQLAALVWRPSTQPPALTGPVPASVFGVSQSDISQLPASFFAPLPSRQGKPPPLIVGQPQTDPTQIGPWFQSSLFRVVSPSGRLSSFLANQPQPDISNNGSVTWTQSTFSVSAQVIATVLPQTNLPTYRKYSWQSLVAKAWGARFNEADIAYEFSKEESERRFYTRDDTGPYKKS